MADVHDSIIVMWQSEYLEDIEGFCFDNILSAAPRRFRPLLWTALLSLATVATVFLSHCLRTTHPWLSGMLGNVAAGLIASVLILAFTAHKERNISFYDHLLFDLDQMVQKMDKTDNNLYHLHHELTCNMSYHSFREYDSFVTKDYLFQTVLLEIYETIKSADKLGYKGFTLTKEQIEKHKTNLYSFFNEVSRAAAQDDKVSGGRFEPEYHSFWSIKNEVKRQLHDYVRFARKSAMIMRYGKDGACYDYSEIIN